MNGLTEAVVTIGSLVIGVAVLSILVSPRANTTGVIRAAASGFSNSLATAMSPVTGAAVTINTGYPAAPNASFGSPMLGAGSPFLQG